MSMYQLNIKSCFDICFSTFIKTFQFFFGSKPEGKRMPCNNLYLAVKTETKKQKSMLAKKLKQHEFF